jgi:hypothetical protein
MGRFLTAVDALQKAQDAALRGKGGQRLRKAIQRERGEIEKLVGAARRIGDGCSEATFDRVRETLEAAGEDPAARAVVQAGTLARELRPGGAIPAAAPSGASAEPDSDASDEDEAREAREAELARLGAALAEAEAEAKSREEAKDAANRQLQQARAELARAREEERKRRSAVRAAERKLGRAKKG